MSVYCAICCDTFKYEDLPHLRPVVLLDCHHVFHDSCVEKYFRSINVKKCPVCRASLKDNGNHKMELHLMYSPSPVFDNLLKEIKELKNQKEKILKQAADERGESRLEIFRMGSALAKEKEQFKKFKIDIQKATTDVMMICKDANKFM